jgi:MFS superfamily sulfate permease-like transporter
LTLDSNTIGFANTIMSTMRPNSLFSEIKYDFPASVVVFFVAMPLCLGIALASGAPLFAGIIAGVVGGIVVGSASGSAIGVSGPAAGLAVIVFAAIATLGSWEAFLVSVMLAGILQAVMGFLRLGTIAYYFPTSVIKGMLSGIGLIIILKQIPHALGYDKDFEGHLSFDYSQGVFANLQNIIAGITPAAVIITIISMIILLLWETSFFKRHRIFQMIQGPLVVVAIGILMTNLFNGGILPYQLSREHLVNIPVANSIGEFLGQFTLPDFTQLTNPAVYWIALVMAVIASLETLLCVEATDKIDPYKRVTPTNRELKAQGVGNILSGLIGGLPITQVIVRSSANITFGARTKASAILHGFFLLISAIAIPTVLNQVPLASLACILFLVGYKLAKPSLFQAMYKLGWDQFVPFVVTVAAIVFTDLLKGIGIGMVVAIFYILRGHYRNAFVLDKKKNGERDSFVLTLAEEVSFLNKGAILQLLNDLPRKSEIVIDGSRTKIIDYDVIEIIRDFQVNAENKDITISVISVPGISVPVTSSNSQQKKHAA